MVADARWIAATRFTSVRPGWRGSRTATTSPGRGQRNRDQTVPITSNRSPGSRAGDMEAPDTSMRRIDRAPATRTARARPNVTRRPRDLARHRADPLVVTGIGVFAGPTTWVR